MECVYVAEWVIVFDSVAEWVSVYVAEWVSELLA